ncbi:MAG: SCO family protein [bacterium]|nr:SCO family protein [bacterium]
MQNSNEDPHPAERWPGRRPTRRAHPHPHPHPHVQTIAGGKRTLLATALFLLLFAAGCEDGSEQLRDFEVDTRIALTDQDGRPFTLQSLLKENKIVLLYFGFTHCPDFCPATLSKLQKVYRILGNRSRHLQTVLVSVDPARDTPAKLKSYVDYFKIDAIALTGTPAEIADVAARYGAHYERQSLETTDPANPDNPGAESYTVDHSTGLYLIDAEGRVRHVFKHGDRPQQIAETLQFILPFF